MDLYNFYRGLENVIDTLQKDRHDLTMKDYLVMCDPFFNVDFYDEKYLNRQIGGGEEDIKEIKTALTEGSEAEKKSAEADKQQIEQNAKAEKKTAEEEAKKKAEEAKEAAGEEENSRKTMKTLGKTIKSLSKQLKSAEKKKPPNGGVIQSIKNELNTAKEKYQKAEALVKKSQNKKKSAQSQAESAKSVSQQDVADAAADLDKEVDEMAPIKKLIKTATKVVVVFAIIVCLPLVPWILISYYSFKKLYGLYISYIQTY